MSSPTAKKAEAKGITKELGRQIVFQRGVYELARRIGCGEDTAKKYAIEELEIPDPPLWTVTDVRSNQDIRHELVREMFAAYEEAVRQNRELSEELAKYRQAEIHREDVKKNEYVKMLHQVKDMRREVKGGSVFSPMQICKEQIDFA